jgi:hypothetical protein
MIEIHKQPLKTTKIIKDSGIILKGVKFTKTQNDIVAQLIAVAFILGLLIGLIF